MEKANIQDLVIELTRRCNMECDHCCRGDVQNINIKSAYLKRLFESIGSIGHLTLTGGEPSLVPGKIEEVLKLAKENNVSIESFYLVTNAKKVTDRFMNAVLDFHLYCLKCRNGYSDEINEIELAISNDGHHSEVKEENIQKLLAFRFAHKKEKNDGRNYPENSIIWEGRSTLNYACYRELDYYPYEIYDNQISEHELYFNCLGNFLPNCNMSYESQDLDGLIIGNIMKDNFDLLSAVIKWNEKVNEMEKTTADCF